MSPGAGRGVLAGLALQCCSASAAGGCPPGATLGECETALVEAARIASKATLGEFAREQLIRFPAGLGFGPDVSSLINFLPLASITGLDTQDSVGHDLGVSGAFSVLHEGDGGDTRPALSGARAPSLIPVAAEALRESGREGTATSLEEALELGDDVNLGLDFNVIKGRFGRDLSRYRTLLDELLFQYEDTVQIAPEQLGPRLRRIDKTGICASQLNAVGRDHVGMTDHLEEYPAGPCRDLIQATVGESARAEAEFQRADSAQYEAAGLKYFGNLVANNPQLTFGAARVQRDELVGASLTLVRATVEFGLTSMARFLWSEQGKPCRKEPADWATCYTNYSGYVARNKHHMARAHRFSATVEYARLEAVDSRVELPPATEAPGGIPLPDLEPPAGASWGASVEGNELRLRLPSASRLTARAGYGFLLKPPQDGDPLGRSARVDIVAKYEDFDAEAVYKTAWSAKATLTFKAAGLSFPLQLAYAGKSEYGVEGIDPGSVVSAIGVGYDFDR